MPRATTGRERRRSPVRHQRIAGRIHTQWCDQEIGETSRPANWMLRNAAARSPARRAYAQAAPASTKLTSAAR
ncbi:hypothetical protein [Nakamurella alba]|uniref:hypothetical protein n=1 Tax=Nakamurella alba TaxID=2665158 RepID=UPI001E33E127|nr:hypothetical protein [Nakamurella alba]